MAIKTEKSVIMIINVLVKNVLETCAENYFERPLKYRQLPLFRLRREAISFATHGL